MDQNQAIMDVKKSVYLIFIITLGAVLDSIFLATTAAFTKVKQVR